MPARNIIEVLRGNSDVIRANLEALRADNDALRREIATLRWILGFGLAALIAAAIAQLFGK